MKIATWNVNSVKARLEAALGWLKEAAPDVAVLQEIKCTDDTFPREAFEALGYNCAVHGQKTYNGVAILSRYPIEDVTPRLPNLPAGEIDEHARYLEAVVTGEHGMLRIASIYAPNGNPVESGKFGYKLAWLERLKVHAVELLRHEEPVALMGDYNVIPQERDCRNPDKWRSDALFQPQSRGALRRVEHLGYTDAFRARHAEGGHYTFWDYQAGSWRRDDGIRIDHILLSPQAADRLGRCEIDKHVRAGDRPSDHVPVWCEIDL